MSLFPNLIRYVPLTTPELPPFQAQGYEYLLAANGLFLRAQNRFLEAVLPLHRFPIGTVRGLLPCQVPPVHLRVPRLGAPLLASVLADARTRRDGGRLIEALYRFYHDGQRLRVLRPPQQASPTHVCAPGDGGPEVLLDLHSHGTLGAFFSQVDNADERGFRFYAVVGCLDSDTPEICLRLGVYGHFHQVPLATLFRDAETLPLREPRTSEVPHVRR